MERHLPDAIFAERDGGQVTEVGGHFVHKLVIAADQDGCVLTEEPELQRLDTLDVVIAMVACSDHPLACVGRAVEAANEVDRAQNILEVGSPTILEHAGVLQDLVESLLL